LISLATRPGVQVELKLTDKQKADVKSLSDKVEARQKEQWAKFAGKRGNGPRGKGNPGGPAGNGAGATAGTATADAAADSSKAKTDDSAGSTKGKTADAKGKTGKASGKGGRPGAGNGGPGGGMFAAFAKQQADDEADLAKILNATQRQRLLQIQLQSEGPTAFAKPDLQKKLNMTDSQKDDVATIMSDSMQAYREAGKAQRDLFGGLGGGRQNRGQSKEDRQKAQEEFKAKMDDPQFKAQLESARAESQAQNEVIRNQTLQQISGVLSKKQKLAYNKMLGTPFDPAKLARDYDPATAPKDAPVKGKAGSKKKTTAKGRKSAA